ncbi:hypothetical protein TorRG33x02_143380 [Trema orientale]|uniref:Transmembrane protein n=1 Tax=Trema orientale TaxID=63057 RepID=A0A2P5EWB5_TREOI|nr:hypothetical protein TorRG33x02_143380 [Trema orientale]
MLMILSIQILRGQARHRFASSILPSLWFPIILPRSALMMLFWLAVSSDHLYWAMGLEERAKFANIRQREG